MVKRAPDNVRYLGQFGEYILTRSFTNAAPLTSVERAVGLRRCGSPFAQRREHRPLARRRFDDDCARHALADQYTLRYLVDVNAHRNPLRKPDPLEGRIGIDEKFGAAGVVAIGDAAGNTVDMPAQCRAAVEEIDFGRYSGMHGGDLGFLEIRRNPIGVAVDQRHDLCADRSILTDFEGEISDKPI